MNTPAIRNRKERDVIKFTKKLDAFRKIPEKYVDATYIGGTLSIISRILIIFLIRKEFLYYLNSNLVFKFIPDVDLDSKLKVHIDLTVSMPCVSIGADIVDSTNQNMFGFGQLHKEDTLWELCPVQRDYFERIQHVNNFLREEYHSIADVLFKDILYNINESLENIMPERSQKPSRPLDACRIHGTLSLNKVAGNFHITAGRSFHLPQGHIHINSIFDGIAYNFSHRIIKFSFGDLSTRIVQPLEGDERILPEATTMAQYFIEVVPTEIHGFMSKINTFQYSVKENFRPIDHDKGSHGVPGLYFKYDMSALKVIVRQDRDNIIQFIIRLCSIIAGIVVISGIINSFINGLHELFIKKVAPEAAYHIKINKNSNHTAAETIPVTNDLLANANRMSDTQISLAIKTDI